MLGSEQQQLARTDAMNLHHFGQGLLNCAIDAQILPLYQVLLHVSVLVVQLPPLGGYFLETDDFAHGGPSVQQHQTLSDHLCLLAFCCDGDSATDFCLILREAVVDGAEPPLLRDHFLLGEVIEVVFAHCEPAVAEQRVSWYVRGEGGLERVL